MTDTPALPWEPHYVEALFAPGAFPAILNALRWYCQETGCSQEVAWLCWVCGDITVAVADEWNRFKVVTFAVLPTRVCAASTPTYTNGGTH